MNEEDFEVIVGELRAWLERVGLADIADVNHYIEMGEIERRAIRPDLLEHDPTSARVIAIRMLAAFERHLAALDADTFKESIGRLSENLDGRNGVEDALIEIPMQMRRFGDLPETLSLSEVPDLRELRQQVRQLIDDFHEGQSNAPRQRRR